jgi:transposase
MSKTSSKQIIKQALAIDVAKGELVCCIKKLDADHFCKTTASRKFANSIKDIDALIAWGLKNKQPGLDLIVLMEATGSYYEHLAWKASDEESFDVKVINPSKVKGFAQSLGTRSKTDEIDADLLARFAIERSDTLRKWQKPEKDFRHLRELLRHRETLLEQRTAISNQYGANQSKVNVPAIVTKQKNEQLKFIIKYIEDIEKEINDHIKACPEIEKSMHLLTSISGVGLITAATIISETDNCANMTSGKQIRAFAGLDPKLKNSGTKKGKSAISKKGSPHIRRCLHNAALSASTHNPRLKTFYQRLIDNNKLHRQALTAVMGKLIEICYSLIKNQKTFDLKFGI